MATAMQKPQKTNDQTLWGSQPRTMASAPTAVMAPVAAQRSWVTVGPFVMRLRAYHLAAASHNV